MRHESSSDVAADQAEDERSITAVADEPSITRERAPEVAPGDVLAGRYQIEAVIGKGGSGVVLRAFDRVSAVVVAVKVLKTALTHDPRWEKRFQRELRLGRPVQHPNVCRIFDIGDADGYRFLTMEHAKGGTLRDLLKKNQPLRPLLDRLKDAQDAIAGLAAIHGTGIVHRDVKPDNMLRMEDGRLVLSDFGLATDLPDSTMVSVFVGTPHYMAPEVREGDPATTRSDVWSLGVVLHEIFFGKRPERRASRTASGLAKSSTTTTSSTIERAMMALCLRCLTDDPAERPEDARGVLRLFESASRSPGSLLRRPRRVALSFAIAATVVGLGVVTAGLYRRARAPLPAQHAGEARIVPDGTPVDWSTVAKLVGAIPGRVHCFSMVGDRRARVVWGLPRRAEDIDVVTGARRLSSLVPETYASGCPELSADQSSLLFTAPGHEGVNEVRLSMSPDGSSSKSIAPGSEPIWLNNGKEFVYDIDPSHAAIFSLPTMTFTLVPASGLGNRQMIAAKAVSKRGNAVALLLVNERSEWAVAIHEGPTFDCRRTFGASGGRFLQFDEADRLLVVDKTSPLNSSLVSVDWRHETARRLGTIPGLEIIGAFEAPASILVVAHQLSSDVWLHDGAKKRRLTSDGRTYSAAISATGMLLLSKWADDGTLAIWRQSPERVSRRITAGRNDTSPDFSRDGRRWAYVDYVNKSVMLCSTENDACRVLVRDELLPAWPRFSPDGARLAYVRQIGTPRLVTVSLDDGRAAPVGPTHLQCPPVWSSATTIWSFEGAGKSRYWLERETGSGAVTGKRIDLDSATEDNCWPKVTDPASPFFTHLEIETEESTELRRLDSVVP
jgi:serine/threonine-protein kinase